MIGKLNSMTFYALVIVIIAMTMSTNASTNTLVIDRNVWIPEKFLSIRSHFHTNSTDSTWSKTLTNLFFDPIVKQDEAGSVFTFEIDGSFSKSTSIFLYVSIPDQPPVDKSTPSSIEYVCETNECKYPGTVFEFKIPSNSKGSKTSVTFNQALLRDAFHSYYDTYSATLSAPPPTSLFIDAILPLDTFLPNTKFPTYYFSFRHNVRETTWLTHDLKIETPLLSKPPTPVGSTYDYFSLNLQKFTNSNNIHSLHPFILQLMTTAKGAYSPLSTHPSITPIPATSMMTTVFGESGPEKSFPMSLSASSKISSLWDIELKSGKTLYESPVINMKVVETENWPRRLTMEMNQAAYIAPPFIFYQLLEYSMLQPDHYRVELVNNIVGVSDWAVRYAIKTKVIPSPPVVDRIVGLMGMASNIYLREALVYRRQTIMTADVEGSTYPVELSTRIPFEGAEEASKKRMIFIGGGIAVVLVFLGAIVLCKIRAKKDTTSSTSINGGYQPLNDNVITVVTPAPQPLPYVPQQPSYHQPPQPQAYIPQQPAYHQGPPAPQPYQAPAGIAPIQVNVTVAAPATPSPGPAAPAPHFHQPYPSQPPNHAYPSQPPNHAYPTGPSAPHF